ncbi:hypothetical protein HHK36_026004 [Tetracentron sinense]|uniref:Glycosyltransferase n=1 Tax=Tetracentron sinense TaxID=13715 RepID=A0A835D430_TETSI|nr:hypothetical protein HHK36_026004 [Tetracentron sinense]
MGSLPPPHVVIFPFMAQGHTLPLLDLSKALLCRGIKVTIITTPSNAPTILQYIPKQPLISLTVIPFPVVEGLPKGCENTSHLPSMDLMPSFLTATMELQQPFERILREMSDTGCLPICVISDFFLGWTLVTCRLFGVPRLVFTGMGVLSMAITKTAWEQKPNLISKSDSDTLDLPGLTLPFALTRADLPDSFRVPDCDDSFHRFISAVGHYDAGSWGVIVNSFTELEGVHVSALESFIENGGKAWCVGPILLYDEMGYGSASDNQLYIQWLDEQAVSGSVIYVSFGSQAHVSDTQLDELAFGLHKSGHRFILVIRSKTWTPPDGLEEISKEKGLIVRDWVDQRRILAHPATGGFLSHCGWNSVLESLSMGVPLLAWPMMAEQRLNAKIVVEGFEVGMCVPFGEKSGLVGREAICDVVRELMGGEKGRKARERVEVVGRMAKKAVQKGGSSDNSLTELIESLSLSTKVKNGDRINDF